MFDALPSPWRVPYDGTFAIAEHATVPPDSPRSKKKLKAALRDEVDALSDLQEVLYASDRVALLLVFQAMDAAGKDSTIRAVMSGVNPAGCQVFSFKQPSSEELDHDFLWRTAKRLPERGRIGVFNRSYYEEVLVVRVHPGILDHQRLPWRADLDTLFEQRLQSIRDHELHLARNGTVVLKFFLNVSADEQRRRFLARIDEEHKTWKFSASDIKERGHWAAYMEAYEAALNATARPWAPWFCVPADNKPAMRLEVARIIRESLESLDLRFPELDPDAVADLATMRARLVEGD